MKKTAAIFLAMIMGLSTCITPVFAESKDPGFTEKTVPVLRDSLESSETATLRYYEDLQNVPYMSVTDFYNQFYLVGTDITEGMTFTNDGSEYTVTNFLGDSAKFDTSAETIIADNFEAFVSSAHFLEATQAGGMDENYPFTKRETIYDPAEPTPLELKLTDYGIDLRGDETGVYAPVATLCDLFASDETYYVVFTGKKLYTRDLSGALQNGAALLDDPDFQKDVMSDHAEDLADFTYRELCFNLDLWYGQPGQELIHDDLKTAKIDDILTEKYPEIRQNLLSTHFNEYATGMFHLFNGLLYDGGHTAIISTVLNDPDLQQEALKTYVDKDYAKKYIYDSVTKQEDKAARIAVQDAAYGGDYYMEQGDTAMIRTNSFAVKFDEWKAFYAGTGERPLEGDTVGTILSGLERASQNPEIKNIIIDMTCNGGGDDFALTSIEWLTRGLGYLRFDSRLTDRVKTKNAQFDMNFDSKFDENDVSPYTDYNFGVLTSNISFSCANAFPWFMHEHGAMILGQKSGGGACAVRLSSACGIEYANSAANSKIVTDSGESVDFGCPVDAELTSDSENPYENSYDIAKLSELMNEYFADALDKAA